MNETTLNILYIAAGIATILGTIIAVVFGVVTINLAKQQKVLAEKQNEMTLQLKPRKHLQIYIESYIPLIRTDKDIRGAIEIFYKKKVITNLASLQVKITNIGNQPITPDDYYRLLDFSVDGTFLDIYQTNASNKDIELIPSQFSGTNILQAEKTLLNQGESVSLVFTIAENDGSSAKNSFAVSGRLVDGEIEFLREKPLGITQSDKPSKLEMTSRTQLEQAAKNFLETVQYLSRNQKFMEYWPLMRDILIIMILSMIVAVMLLDAMIPF